MLMLCCPPFSFFPGRISIAAVAKAVLSDDPLPDCYTTTVGGGGLHVENDTAPSMIKTCLLDPNFPKFVEEVEKQVASLINP